MADFDLSIDVGAPTPLRVMTNDIDELFAVLSTLNDRSDDLFETMADLKQMAIAKGVYAAPVKDTPAKPQSGPAAPGAPTCKHGPMKDCAGMGYKKRWYCEKRGKDKECWAKD